MKTAVILLFLLFVPDLVMAEVVTLESGVVIEGKITERALDYIRIDFKGQNLTFFSDEIASIEGNSSANDSFSVEDPLALELVREVLSVSGLKDQIDRYPDILRQSLQKEAEGKAAEAYAVVSRVILENFSPEIIYQELVNKVRERYNENNLALVRDFFKSPLASKIVAMELEAGSPGQAQELENYSRSLELNPPYPPRLEAVKRLSAAAGVENLSVHAALELGFSVIKAVNASDLVTPDKKKDQSAMDELKNQLREQLSESAGRTVIQSLLYTYRSLSDEDLEQYTLFYESPVGRWFVNIVLESFSEGLTLICERTAESMVDVIAKARLIR